MKTFTYSGGLICSDERDFETYLSAKSRGSEEVWGRYELAKAYVAEIVKDKPDFVGLQGAELKIVNSDEPMENGKMYAFLILKIVTKEVRTLEKIKFRNLGEISKEEIANYPEEE